MTYKVFVDDKFHYMDEDERYPAGEYKTLEKAIAKCRKIIDRAKLMRKEGVRAEDLFKSYLQFGEDPWIQGGEFSARDYARERCQQICSVKRKFW